MRYLYDKSETIVLEYDSELFEHPFLSSGNKVVSGVAGGSVGPLRPGHYLIYEQTGAPEKRVRYLGVVGDHSVVLQMTVGAFTSDFFDSVAHAKRVPVNYYVASELLGDSTFRGYEQDYGDAVYPHLMPNNLSFLGPAFRQLDANWESLDEEQIVERLKKIDEWFQSKGFAPLHGFATYTPSNSLIRAMKRVGWTVLHSVIPEQNWSDGHWAINHWGMPNQPFYAAGDDFRKPAPRAPEGMPNVLEMTMNSYHLYMPHVVNWGDNVLSPSHFLRWHRTVESGAYPERFRNFLIDYLKAAEFKKTPFFLTAGFEFGRSFGVRSMTRHNRRGMSLILDLAARMPIVFATGRDVAAYYEKFCPVHPEIVFTQRDYLAGTRIMDKPINSGPSIGMEMEDYKAVFAHLDPLPYYHYDYREVWNFKTDDTSAPHDCAPENRSTIHVDSREDRMQIAVDAPLKRKTPIALWDARPLTIDNPDIIAYHPPVLDDGRRHTVIVLPEGFQGVLHLRVEQLSVPPATEFTGVSHPLWRVQTIGTHSHCQCYLYLDTPLLGPLPLRFTVPAPCRIDTLERPLGEFRKGDVVELCFDSRRTWFRFYGLRAEEIRPSAEAAAAIDAAAAEWKAFSGNASEELARVHREDDLWFRQQIPEEETVVLEVDCFGNHVFGERSRALPFDRVVRCANPALSAKEYADGGISLGRGKSFWVHPRTLHFVVAGLDSLGLSEGEAVIFRLYNTTPASEVDCSRYQVWVESDGEKILTLEQPWTCPRERSRDAILEFSIPVENIRSGAVEIFLNADQMGVLDDWFADGGFIAALERIIVSVRNRD